MIGEPKHGIWRVHDNGHIREYRKFGKRGLEDVDANGNAVDPNGDLTRRQTETINDDYTHFMPDDASIYKYPDERLNSGRQQFLDLTIYHPKYGGKYNKHVPIDLPYFYCRRAPTRR